MEFTLHVARDREAACSFYQQQLQKVADEPGQHTSQPAVLNLAQAVVDKLCQMQLDGQPGALWVDEVCGDPNVQPLMEAALQSPSWAKGVISNGRISDYKKFVDQISTGLWWHGVRSTAQLVNTLSQPVLYSYGMDSVEGDPVAEAADRERLLLAGTLTWVHGPSDGPFHSSSGKGGLRRLIAALSERDLYLMGKLPALQQAISDAEAAHADASTREGQAQALKKHLAVWQPLRARWEREYGAPPENPQHRRSRSRSPAAATTAAALQAAGSPSR